MQRNLSKFILALLIALPGCSFEAGQAGLSDQDAGPRDAMRDSGLAATDAGPKQSCQPLVGGDDDFEDGFIAAIWLNYFGEKIQESEGALSIIVAANSPETNGATLFNNSLSLIGNRLFIEMVDAGDQAKFAGALIRFGNDNADFRMQVTGAKLSYFFRSSGTKIDEVEIDYDPVAHRFWQLREEDGFVYAEVGATANDWSVLSKAKVDLQDEINALSNAYLGLQGFASEEASVEHVIKFDNFNTGSNCP